MLPPDDPYQPPPPQRRRPESGDPPPEDPYYHPFMSGARRPLAPREAGTDHLPPIPEPPAPGFFGSAPEADPMGPGGPLGPGGMVRDPGGPPLTVPGPGLPEAPFEDDNEWPPRWLVVLLVAVLPLVLVAVYFRQMFFGLTHGDALDFAQLGRNLMEGRGFVTYILRPLTLQSGTDPFVQPEVTHGPFYPFLLACWFGALSVRDSSVAALSALFYVLTVPVVYLLGARSFNRGVGVMAAVIFATNKQMLEYAISGLHLTLCLFLTTLLFLLLYRALETCYATEALSLSPPPPPAARGVGNPPGSALDEIPEEEWETPAGPARPLILAGVVAGLLVLAEPLMLWLLPALVWTVRAAHPVGRQPRTLQFLAGAGVLLLPWMLRNFQLSGNPVLGMRGLEFWMAGSQPLALAYRMDRQQLLTGFSQLPAVLHKAGLGLDQVLAALPTLTGVWLVGAVLPSLFIPPPPVAARLRGLTLSCFGLLLVGSLLLRIDMPLFALLVPVLVVFAVAYYQYLFFSSPLPRRSVALVTVALVGMLVYPTLGAITVRPKPAPLQEASVASALKFNLDPKDVVLSDQPWIVAWHADRPSLWIPASEASLAELRKTYPTTRWLFLTTQGRAFSHSWATLFDVFLGWRNAVRAAKQQGRPAPEAMGIRQGDPDPLFGQLAGLKAIDVDEPSAPSVVLASFPEPRSSRR